LYFNVTLTHCFAQHHAKFLLETRGKKKIKKEAGPYSGLKIKYEQASPPEGKNKL